ncbi:MAG: 3'-5' exoribonuclease [Paraprevotella sp.]|nr:3'-5' exoribonuclease [Paraprevotella sp.]
MTKQRIDIMVDIETLGRSPSSPIVQISAVKFDITTGCIYDSFDVTIDVSQSTTIEGGTLLWWLQTDAELLKTLMERGQESGLSEKDAIQQFCTWAMEKPINAVYQPKVTDVFLWGNGILFDNRLIQSKCQQHNIPYPIFYRNDRDMRTLVELAALKTGNGSEFEYRSHFESIGTRHNALDDCLFQVKVLCQAYNDVMGINA